METTGSLGEGHRDVLIVIPTKNSEPTISRLLKSVENQTYRRITTVVVDNASGDRTAEIARSLGSPILFAGPERSAQRNIGPRFAPSEFLFFVDSDMILPPALVADCVESIEGFDALIVPESTLGTSFLARTRRFERDAYGACGLFEYAIFFRRHVFEKIGGYDKEITGVEDLDIQAKLNACGFRTGRSHVEIMHDESDLSLPLYLRKRRYYGRTDMIYRRRYPGVSRQEWSPIIRLRAWSKNLRWATLPLFVGVVCLRCMEALTRPGVLRPVRSE